MQQYMEIHMKAKTLLATILVIMLILMTGCSLSASGRQGGQNNASVEVTTCPEATSVGQGSCGASVIWLGGGN